LDNLAGKERNTPRVFALPPGFRQTKCIYEVSYNGGRVKQAHDIQPGGKIDQEFVAADPYIVSFDTNIGLNPAWTSQKTGTVEMDLLDGDFKPLAHYAPIQIINNGATKFQFSPVPVQPGKPYWIRVVNTSSFIISIYMRYRPGPNGKPRKPVGAKRTNVYGEVNRDDVGRPDDALVGCVTGARRTGP
jgi:hypothetical protein